MPKQRLTLITQDELKSIEIDILSYIHNICVDNNIRYWIAFGTLLGAVRHGGFIPWDDDIDVCMFREDYEKFISVMNNIDNDKYSIITPYNHDSYYFTFSRVVDDRTVLKLKGLRHIHDLGVFVDVFPIDDAPDDPQLLKQWQIEISKAQEKTRSTVPIHAHYDEHSMHTCLRIMRNVFRRLKYGSRNFIRYRNEWNNLLRKYNGREYNNCICENTNWLYPKSLFSELTTITFEGREFYAPQKWHDFLEYSYGEYMKLPPIEERVSHHNFIAYWKR